MARRKKNNSSFVLISTDLLNLLDLLTVENIFIFRLLQFSHQFHKKQLPSIFDNYFRYASDDHTYNTTSMKHASGCRLWQLTIGKNYHMTLKISIFPFSPEKLNSIY